jgi:hypothetical protein
MRWSLERLIRSETGPMLNARLSAFADVLRSRDARLPPRFAVLRRAVLVNGLINSTPVTSASNVRESGETGAHGEPDEYGARVAEYPLVGGGGRSGVGVILASLRALDILRARVLAEMFPPDSDQSGQALRIRRHTPPDRQSMLSKSKVAYYGSTRMFAYEWPNMLAISVLHCR